MSKLKANLAVQNKYEAFYTGGQIQFSQDGEYILCECGNKVQVLEVNSGKVAHSLGQDDDDDVTSFALSPDGQVLVVASRMLVLRQWDWKEKLVTRTWKNIITIPLVPTGTDLYLAISHQARLGNQAIHTAPVSCMGFDSTSTLLATGGSDATIKVWDVIQQYCTHNLRGHQGVVSVVKFHPDAVRLQLFTAAEDYKIRSWDLQTSTCLGVLDSHYSVITCLQFSADGETMYSGGRDNVITVWEIKGHKKRKTVPVYESVEGLVLLQQGKKYEKLGVTGDQPCFVTAGSKGLLKVWNADTAQCIHTQEMSGETTASTESTVQPITSLTYSAALDTLNVVTFDHNILLYKEEDWTLSKQFAANNDEVLDIRFVGPNDSHVVVATNSELLKVFEVDSWSCQILRGHTDIVVSLDVFKKGFMFASSSKDNTVRVWQMDTESLQVRCVAAASGHAHAVGTVAVSRLTNSFITSGSQDCTLKIWPLDADFPKKGMTTLHATLTERAHEKDINSVTVSPNDKLIATGSQDKTAKLWSSSDLSLVGVMRGHKRGIWCVQFSPVDQCVATASADGTIKIWALTDFICVKTFEGHDSSVLRVHFLTRGMQLISSGSDGLLKLWTIKTSECVKTFDEHEDKAWALAVSRNEDIVVTGAADSRIITWKDVTETEVEEARQKQEELILKEQELSNLIHQKKYLKAIGLAITLEQPFKVLNIMKEILDEPEGKCDLESTLSKLRPDQTDAVLRFAVEWNTNSKNCHVAQCVVSVVLKHLSPDDLLHLPNIKSTLEGLLPYTERHFQRMNRLMQQSTFVDYTWHSMKLVDRERQSSPKDTLEGTSASNTDVLRTDTTVEAMDDTELELNTDYSISHNTKFDSVHRVKKTSKLEKSKRTKAVSLGDSEIHSEEKKTPDGATDDVSGEEIPTGTLNKKQQGILQDTEVTNSGKIDGKQKHQVSPRKQGTSPKVAAEEAEVKELTRLQDTPKTEKAKRKNSGKMQRTDSRTKRRKSSSK